LKQLRMEAADGKQRLTDCADADTLPRIVQSVPSPKAEPVRHWLATVGMERLEEMENPSLAIDGAASIASRAAIAMSGSRTGCAAS
jgi:hypothetical protein